MANSNAIQTVLRPSPFTLQAIPHTAQAGQSIEDILRFFPGLPPEVWTHGVVCIGEWEIPRERWHAVKPRAGTRHMLQIAVRPAGGKGGQGGKNAFAIIATIALIVVTTAISGGILGPGGALSISSTLFAAGSTSAALAAVGVSVVGALAINALVPPPTSAKSEDKGVNATLGLASIEGNSIGQFEPIPFVAGRHRITPPHLVPPWTESLNDDQYVNAIVGVNGAHRFSDIRLNDTPIDSFSDVDYEIRDVVNDDTDITLITRQVFETQIGSELPGHKVKDDETDKLQDASTPANSYPTWQASRSRRECDEIWLTFLWSGLVNQETSGGTAPAGVGLRLRIRQIGATTWINLPEFHVQREKLEPFRGTIKLRFDTPDFTLPRPDQNPSVPPWKYVFYAQNADNQEGFDTDSYFNPGTGKLAAKVGSSPDGAVIVFLDPATFPKGSYEVQVIRGYGYKAADLNVSTYVYLSVSAPFFFTHTPSSSPPAIGKEQAKVPTKISWQSISGVWNEYPLKEKGMSLLAVRAKNVAISSLTMLAEGYVNIWDGIDWNTFEPSSNPAAIWRTLALGGQSVRTPFVAAQFESGGLEEWYDFCGDRRAIGRTFNGTDDYLTRDGGLTGAADSKLMSFSGWVLPRNLDAEILSASATLAGGENRLRIEMHSSGVLILVATNAAGTIIFGAVNAGGVLALGQWHHIAFGVDLTDVNKYHLYIDDVDRTATPFTFTNDTIDFTVGDFAAAGAPDGTNKLDGDLAEIWFAPGVHLDFSVEANRRKFITANGRPADLGATGNRPTGSAPLVYLGDKVGSGFGTNKGTGGGFTAHLAGGASAYPLAPVIDAVRYPTRECNAYFSGNNSLGDVLKIVAACGHAAGRISDKVGVIVERDRSDEGPIALFSQRNSRGLSIRRAFPRVPDGLRVRFNDEGNDYKPTEIFVYRNPDGDEIEAVDYVGITSPDRARERALLDFKQLLRRPALYQLETDIQNLYCTKGSLVALTHDTLRRHFDSGRIVSASLSGGVLTGLVMDSALRFALIGEGGDAYPAGVIIQLKDGSTLVGEVAETTDSITVTFADPPDLPEMFTDRGAWATSTAYAIDDVVSVGGAAWSALAAHTSGASTQPGVGASYVGVWEPLLMDCLAACGPFSSVEKRMLVLGIKPQNQLTAALTLIDEAAPVPLLSSVADGGQELFSGTGEPLYAPF